MPRPPVSNGRPRRIQTPRIWRFNAKRALTRPDSIGKEADAAYTLCEQALAIDPNNVHALTVLGVKFYSRGGRLALPATPKATSSGPTNWCRKALALDPDWANAHDVKGNILRFQGRTEEAVAEDERALALDPSDMRRRR